MIIGRTKAKLISQITIDEDVDFNSFSLSNMGNISLVKNSGLQFLVALLANGDWCGLTAPGQAGEDISAGEVCYLKSDYKFWLCDADYVATMPVKVMATADILANAIGVFLLQGFMRVDAWDWTVGDILYAHTTPGALVATPPGSVGDQVQRLGIAVTADSIDFRPSKDVFEVT